MAILRTLRNALAPDFSTRSIAYGILRESARHPSAILKRIHPTNFRNYAALRKLTIDCNVCGTRSGVFYDFPNITQRHEHGIALLRETVSCRACGATMRHRTLAHGLLEQVHRLSEHRFSSLRDYRGSSVSLNILDTDCYSPLHRTLAGKPGYLSSKYLPGTPFGTELSAGVYNIDLQSISFRAERFDIVMTSDVMEHVENDDQAHREIYRVLRAGGSYVFTVPYNANLTRNHVLAFASEGGCLYNATPHFHGDPITGGILAYRIYGRQLVDSLSALGMRVEFHEVQRAVNGIFAGDCFTATKQPGAVSEFLP